MALSGPHLANKSHCRGSRHKRRVVKTRLRYQSERVAGSTYKRRGMKTRLRYQSERVAGSSRKRRVMKTRLRYQNERATGSKYQRRNDFVGPQHNQNGSIRQRGLAKAFALVGMGPQLEGLCNCSRATPSHSSSPLTKASSRPVAAKVQLLSHLGCNCPRLPRARIASLPLKHEPTPRRYSSPRYSFGRTCTAATDSHVCLMFALVPFECQSRTDSVEQRR